MISWVHASDDLLGTFGSDGMVRLGDVICVDPCGKIFENTSDQILVRKSWYVLVEMYQSS